MVTAEETSGGLCFMGKQLFDEAVERASSSACNETDTSLYGVSLSSFPSLGNSQHQSAITARSAPSYATSKHGNKRLRHNGPTAIGSPIYNKVELLSTRSITPSPQPQMQRSKTAPEIKRYMDRITTSYKVVPSCAQSVLNGAVSSRCSTINLGAEYLLIPKDGETQISMDEQSGVSKNMLHGFRYRQPEDENSPFRNRKRNNFMIDNETGNDVTKADNDEHPIGNGFTNIKVTDVDSANPLLAERNNQATNPGDANGLLKPERPSSACSSRSV